jgi:hypothetical protein
MIPLYRLARGAGYSVLRSLAWALFNWPPPTPTESERKQQERDYIARIADLDRRSREQR